MGDEQAVGKANGQASLARRSFTANRRRYDSNGNYPWHVKSIKITSPSS